MKKLPTVEKPLPPSLLDDLMHRLSPAAYDMLAGERRRREAEWMKENTHRNSIYGKPKCMVQ